MRQIKGANQDNARSLQEFWTIPKFSSALS